MKSSLILDKLLTILPSVWTQHAPQSGLHGFLSLVARREVESVFMGNTGEPVHFGPYGTLVFPHHSMGAVDSLNLMDLDELIMFSFYWRNRNRYRNVLDVGANIGLHSVLLSKCGFAVSCFEPDPAHFELLRLNLATNEATSVTAKMAAVSSCAGQTEFVRVLGNTTGSHLAGSKPNPYGELERFDVETVPMVSLLQGVDLLKLDAEGHEKNILLTTTADHWDVMDGLISVHDNDNATALFEHFSSLGIGMFSQKINWHRVSRVSELPQRHHEGTLFLTSKDSMPWGTD